MRRVLVVAALFAASCQWIDLDRGRKYPCDPGAVLDGGQRVFDATQCPSGWRCGLEGQCHDPNDPSPFKCVSQDDCATSWRCGVNDVCHPRTGGPYPCALDTDCEASWRCGVNQICHPRDAGAWPCQLDTDCEASWRCGIDGVCLDASGDAIRANAYSGTLDTSIISPLVTTSAVPAFSTTQTYQNYQQQNAYTFALNDGTLLHDVSFPFAFPNPDGGPTSIDVSFRASLSSGLAPSDLATSPQMSVAQLAPTTFQYFYWDAGAVASPQFTLANGYYPVVQLRMTQDNPPLVLGLTDPGFSSTQFVHLLGDQNTFPYSDSFPSYSGTLPPPGTDLAFLHSGGQPDCLLAAHPTGLFAANRFDDGGFASTDGGVYSAPHWEALGFADIAPDSCGFGVGFRPSRLYPSESGNELAMSGFGHFIAYISCFGFPFPRCTVVYAFSPTPSYVALLGQGGPTKQSACAPSNGCGGRVPTNYEVFPCSACPTGSVPKDVRVTQQPGTGLEIRCASALDGGADELYFVASQEQSINRAAP